MNAKVIASEYMPARLPLHFTVLAYLLMDHFEAGQMALGIGWTLVVIIWLLCLARWFSVDGVKPSEI